MTERRRHPRNALTPRSVAALKEPGRFADGGGLYVLVAPGGSKSWVLRTLVRGRRRDIGLGSVALVGLADARAEAVRLRRIARLGGDPLEERRASTRGVPTFEQAARAFHQSISGGFRNEKHRKQWLASLAGVLNAFGTRQVSQVTSADVLNALSPIWLTRQETSRRVLQRVRAVLDWSKAQGYRSGDNPAEGVAKVLPPQRRTTKHHAALAYPQVPSFLNELRKTEANDPVRLALEFAILTAARTSEVLKARWDEFNLADGTWTIPADRMKAGLEHRVPLPPRALAVLKVATGLSADSSGYVFPSRRGAPFSNMALLMLLRRMGRRDITVHGFRSSFRDWAAERTNTPSAVCEAALAHTVRNKVEAAYNRTDLFERRRALMNAWARFLGSGVKEKRRDERQEAPAGSSRKPQELRQRARGRAIPGAHVRRRGE